MSDVKHHARRPGGLGLLTVAVVALIVVGCSVAPPSVTPPSEPPPASASPSTTVAPPTPTATPAPTVAPSASPTSASPCPVEPETGRLPSDRMTQIRLQSTPTADLVIFIFGSMSVPAPPQGPSTGSLETAVPPYTEAASGAEITMTGEHVVQVRFDGMTLMNDVGEPTYDGPIRLEPSGFSALREVVNYDMFEGISGWLIGYDGNGCVTLASDATSVTVAIEHAGS